MKPENENNYVALATLLNAESIKKLKDQLIKVLVQHTNKDITTIECVAIQDLFDVGAEEILGIKEILERK